MALTLKLLLVIRKVFNSKRPFAVTSVALSHIARRNAAHAHGNNFSAKQTNHGLQRPYPAKTTVSRFHRFRPRETIHDIWNEFAQNIRRICARFFNNGDIKLALLWVGLNLRLGYIRQPCCAHKTFKCALC